MGIRTVRARLTIWYVGVLTGAFLMLGTAGYGLLAYTLSNDVDASLTAVAQTLAEKYRRGGDSLIPSDIDEVFRRFFGFSPMDRYYGMLDPQGRPEYRRVPPSQHPLSAESLEKVSKGLPVFETLNDHGPYPVRLLTFPVVDSGRVTRLIQVGMSLESLHQTRQRYLAIMAFILAVGLFAAGGGGWFLVRRALEPVDRMTEAARRISGEHLAERLGETGSGDELDRLANTLNGMLSRLDESFQQVRRFSADASHELQTPLTVMKGEMEVALRSPRSVDEYREILGSSLEEVERMSRLVEALLTLARDDAGVLKMDRLPVELSDLIEDVQEQLKGTAQARGVELLRGPVEPIRIKGDPERLRRLLLNLVENGIKYTPKGGRVSISLKRQGDGWASVEVEDTGIGISPEDQSRIFQRFHRGADARSLENQGSGLGLCIAKSIAEAHGGGIKVVSSPGQGSAFEVLLPIQ